VRRWTGGPLPRRQVALGISGSAMGLRKESAVSHVGGLSSSGTFYTTHLDAAGSRVRRDHDFMPMN
jgi:hypothetical protein